MFWPTITELSLLTRQILMKLFENLAWLGTKSVRFTSGKKRPQPAPLGCGLSTSATAETAAVLSFRRQSLQNCNDWQDKFFEGRPSDYGGAKNRCENDKSSADNSNRRRPRVQCDRATQRATRRSDRVKVASRLCSTNN